VRPKRGFDFTNDEQFPIAIQRSLTTRASAPRCGLPELLVGIEVKKGAGSFAIFSSPPRAHRLTYRRSRDGQKIVWRLRLATVFIIEAKRVVQRRLLRREFAFRALSAAEHHDQEAAKFQRKR